MDADEFFSKIDESNTNETLRVKDAPFGYYKLREGIYAGRVIIKTCAKIDDETICFFANELTWIYTKKIGDVLCEIVCPQFSQGQHSVNYSQATWYGDNNSEPQHYQW